MSADTPHSSELSDENIEILSNSIQIHLSNVEDPRTRSSRVLYPVESILFISIAAVLGGANSIKEIHGFAESREMWLREILDLPHGIPRYWTLWWVLGLIKPELLNSILIDWTEGLSKGEDGRIIAIDGKASRGTALKGKSHSFIHIVSAWACEDGLTLGQCKVEDKSNEIACIPSLLQQINVKGAVVTMDAMGTQTEIAASICNAKADYVLALKKNHPGLYNEVENMFRQAVAVNFEGVEHSMMETKEQGHGRKERRTVYTLSDIEWLPQKVEWEGLKSVTMVISERICEGVSSVENRYYISSLQEDAARIGYCIRTHWSIENQCHWVLDMGFREDAQKAREADVAENLSILRRIALNLLKQDKKTKGGIELKRKKAGWNVEYLLQLLNIKFS